MNNPYLPVGATIREVVEESPTIRSFVLLPDEPVPFLTGQFLALTVPGVGEAPFTPSSSQYVTDRLELTVMRVGTVTEALHAMRPGDRVGVRGPFGTGYPLDAFRGRGVLVVGGGVGLAPLRSLLLTLRHDIERYRKVALRYGARTPADIIYRREVEEWRRDGRIDVAITVDRGDGEWTGRVGLVTTILQDTGIDPRDSVAVVCGPPVMMKFATFKLLDIGFPPAAIHLSMEKNMSCGFGKCGHCRLGTVYVCRDGPVLTYERVKDFREIWE
ncbi:MAG: FAD/NAD(P)-binding protein [bacterium]|nr:FAD/NAD(P)-binding protein [bacterium]